MTAALMEWEREKITGILEGGFDRRLTEQEIDDLLETYGYDPNYYAEDGSDTPREIFDRFGNPTRPSLDVLYEKKHGIDSSGGSMTLEEAIAKVHALCSGQI